MECINTIFGTDHPYTKRIKKFYARESESYNKNQPKSSNTTQPKMIPNETICDFFTELDREEIELLRKLGPTHSDDINFSFDLFEHDNVFFSVDNGNSQVRSKSKKSTNNDNRPEHRVVSLSKKSKSKVKSKRNKCAEKNSKPPTSVSYFFKTAGGNSVANDLDYPSEKATKPPLHSKFKLDDSELIDLTNLSTQKFFGDTRENNDNANESLSLEREKPIPTEANLQEEENKARLAQFKSIASITHEKLSWDKVGGLRQVKSRLNEAIIQPLKRPDLFSGVRSPPKGVLLFGPPGNGKTLLARCIASQLTYFDEFQKQPTGPPATANCTFITLHTADIMSKWVGESEKQIKALFEYASENQPAVIFIDEVDSIFQKRTDESKVSDVRIVNEFLARIDGTQGQSSQSIYLIGATNRPQMIDDAALRRLTLKFYVPLPDTEARISIAKTKLKCGSCKFKISKLEWSEFGSASEGYSGDDIAKVISEAAMIPLRLEIEKFGGDITKVGRIDSLSKIDIGMLVSALKAHKPTSQNLEEYEKWGRRFGANF